MKQQDHNMDVDSFENPVGSQLQVDRPSSKEANPFKDTVGLFSEEDEIDDENDSNNQYLMNLEERLKNMGQDEE